MKKTLKWIGIISGGLVTIIIVLGIISVATTEEPSIEPMTSPTTNPAATPAPIPKSFSDQEVTEDTVGAALWNLSGSNVALGEDIYRVEVFLHAGTDNPDDYIVHIYFKPDSFWDAEDFAEISVHTSIKSMEALFQNRKVSEVVMWGIAEFSDKYGATKNETAIRLLMTRTTADQVVNWKAVDDRAWSDYTTFFDLAEMQYIHPAMAKDLQD